jgi:hypothetical protein
VYGTDNCCTHDAAVRLGARGRGVAVLEVEVDEVALTPQCARPSRAAFRPLPRID